MYLCATNNLDMQNVSLCTTSSADVPDVSLSTPCSTVCICRVCLFAPPGVWMCRVYPFHCQSCRHRVYPFPPLAVWTCRMYPFLPPGLQYRFAGCISLHHQRYWTELLNARMRMSAARSSGVIGLDADALLW